MSIRDEVNSELVSVSVDVSHEDLGRQKGICFLLAPKNPTVNLTATSNSDLFWWIPMMTNIKITNRVPLMMKKTKPKIQLSQLNNHLVLEQKLRQIYLYILLNYL